MVSPVVGQDASHANAASGEVPHRPLQKTRRDRLRLVREHFGLREARAVVDGHVHRLPADAARAACLVTMNAMPDVADLVELLDIEMEQIAGRGPFIAIGGTRRDQTSQVIEAEPPLLAHDRGDGVAYLTGDAR